jgi:hypothetical protein
MALGIPESPSERDEADWWYDHREEVSEDFAQAAARGEVVSFREVLRQHGLSLPDAYVSVPFSADELARVQVAASSRGLGAEEYIGRLVNEALQAERAA